MSLVYLFTPGDSRSKLEKTASGGADAVIVDLEDGVAADSKAFAREQAFAFLDERRHGEGASTSAKPIYIRCNPADSPHFGDDLRLVRESGAAGAMITKCESADELRAANEAAPEAELIPLIETARGVSQVEAIVAAAVGRIRKVAFGAVDFALDIGADWSVGGGAYAANRRRVSAAR
ncbi:MAG: HpcH/HpaI aldolase [Paenibacillus sp.]|nr:HpcH/HpaI aldolase [Paenibacillus sp.]